MTKIGDKVKNAFKKDESPLNYAVAEEERLLSDKIKKKLRAGESYKESQGYYANWEEFQKFWESDQWSQSTEKTKDFPRPVTNHFKEIIEMKVAGLTYEPPDMYYEPKKGSLKNDKKVKCKAITEGAEDFEIKPEELLKSIVDETARQINMQELLESFTRSAGLLNTGVIYSDWDNTLSSMGGEGAYIGDIKAMEIDISDFFPGDPTERSIQGQPYIIITERRPLEQVRDEYEKYSDSASLVQSEQQSDRKQTYSHEKTEHSETDYVDLIHYWEKKHITEDVKFGEGDDQETVKRHDIHVDYYVICQNYVLRKQEDRYKSKLYPFVSFTWHPRRKSFFGVAESSDLINNQKELNRLAGIALLGAYKTGLPNVVYNDNFIKKEDIPVGPGGNVIKDETPPGHGRSIEYLQPPTIASYIPLLKDSMSQGMKDTSGVHEAWSGKAPSAHLNASAIMALQEAAGVRIKPIQRRLYNALQELGEIWLGYIKQYYTENRMFKVYGKDNAEGIAWFNPSDFKDMQFTSKVAMDTASPYSKTVIAETLQNMLTNGVIDGDLYLKMLPPEVFPKITELLELAESKREEQQQQMIDQQKQIVDEMVGKVMEKAKKEDMEINREALEEMRKLIKQESKEIGV